MAQQSRRRSVPDSFIPDERYERAESLQERLGYFFWEAVYNSRDGAILGAIAIFSGTRAIAWTLTPLLRQPPWPVLPALPALRARNVSRLLLWAAALLCISFLGLFLWRSGFMGQRKVGRLEDIAPAAEPLISDWLSKRASPYRSYQAEPAARPPGPLLKNKSLPLLSSRTSRQSPLLDSS